MHHLRDVGVGRQRQDDVVERNRTNEVDEEPRSEVVSRDRYRLHDDVLHELVRDDTYTAPQRCLLARTARNSLPTGIREYSSLATSRDHQSNHYPVLLIDLLHLERLYRRQFLIQLRRTSFTYLFSYFLQCH